MRAPGRIHAPRSNASGLTLLEVLIAVVILSIGLLGLAGLQTTSLKFSTSAYYRTQATALAYGLADRMRSDREAALDGQFNGAVEDPPPACDPDMAPGATAADALAAWRNALACRLPAGTGAIAANGGDVTITVQWDDSRGEDPPMQFEFTTGL